MKPFIMNAHLGEEENQVMLFVSFSRLHLLDEKGNRSETTFADELGKKGYEVIEYKPCSVFFGKEADSDGGYAFTVIENCFKFEQKLLQDAYQIFERHEQKT